jgi:hypothetical protein
MLLIKLRLQKEHGFLLEIIKTGCCRIYLSVYNTALCERKQEQDAITVVAQLRTVSVLTPFVLT